MGNHNGILDARKELGYGKTFLLGFQHVFAMFGATVLVPLLTGLSVSVTLFCAGIATLWFHFITKGKVPIFLGSSFAFLAAFGTVAPMENGVLVDPSLIPYATGGVVCAGAVYVVLAILIQVFGVKKVMKLFPPVVTGPIIVLIGINLSTSALSNILTHSELGKTKEAITEFTSKGGQYYPYAFVIAIFAILVIIACNIWGKGMVKVLPILIGIVAAYIFAIIWGELGLAPKIDFSNLFVHNASQIPGSINIGNSYCALPPFHLPKFRPDAIIVFVVVALAAVVEHIGDIAAIGGTCGKNFIKNPGLTRTLLGDGIGTSLAGLIGGPANTTYSENTGVVALTGVYDPFVLRVAAFIAIILSFFPFVDNLISTIPGEIIGGISFVVYGLISAVGLRTLVENKVNFNAMRNVVVAAIILVSGIAFNSQHIVIPVGTVTLEFGGLACAAIFGIVLNAILPGKDYKFDDDNEPSIIELLDKK